MPALIPIRQTEQGPKPLDETHYAVCDVCIEHLSAQRRLGRDINGYPLVSSQCLERWSLHNSTAELWRFRCTECGCPLWDIDDTEDWAYQYEPMDD